MQCRLCVYASVRLGKGDGKHLAVSRIASGTPERVVLFGPDSRVEITKQIECLCRIVSSRIGHVVWSNCVPRYSGWLVAGR